MTEMGGGSFDSGSFDSGSFDSGSLDSGSLDTSSAFDTTSSFDTGLDTSSDFGTSALPDTTTQSFTSFAPDGSLSPGDPGTTTLGTDSFALTPTPSYTSDPVGSDLFAPPTSSPSANSVVADDFSALSTADPSTGFMANIPGMMAGSQTFLGLTQDSLGTTNTLGGLSLAVPSFGQFGSEVGVMNGQLQSQQTTALSQLLSGMQGIGTSIGTAADGYSSADSAVAQGFGGLQDGSTTTTTPAATDTTAAAPTSSDPIISAVGTHHYGDSGADVTAIQNQLNAAGYNVGTADGSWGIRTQAALAQYAADHNLTVPGQPNQLDQRAIDGILDAEGNNANFTQGGRHEIYGIREGNPGYAAVSAASQQFGVGSAGERAAASQVVQNAYNSAGFTGFTDPGEQAALASAIHMRGPGGGTGVQGTSAILHGMATGTVDARTAATPDDITAVQAMTPDQFQTAFRTAREAYDQAAYGNTTTNLNGTRQNWWSAYGHGLQNRYDAEEQRFRAMSGGTP